MRMEAELVIFPITVHGVKINPLRSNVPLLVNDAADSMVRIDVALKSSFKIRLTEGLTIIEPPVSMVVSSMVTSAVTVTVCPFLIAIAPLLRSGTQPQSQVLISFQFPLAIEFAGVCEYAAEETNANTNPAKNLLIQAIINSTT